MSPPPPHKQKLYCYVDETGQDTEGRLFIVAVVVTAQDRDTLLQLCERFEKVSGKHKDKWGKAKYARRLSYLRLVLADPRFKNTLRYCLFQQTRDYDAAMVAAICEAIFWLKPTSPYTSLVYVDGLRKTKRHEYGRRLRLSGLPVRQVRGVARDESNALIRLADALAGFVRDALTGEDEAAQALYNRALLSG